jgi:2-keto-4-pentenoate hydratase/2-oxohepta-3-ene-1,7-dioic acid hydratase in catechol pathway
MKFCRFLPPDSTAAHAATPLYGLLEGGQIQEISGPPWASWSRGSRTWPVAEARLLAPVEPTKIVCVGRNYREHAAELDHEVPVEPLLFFKPPSSLIASGDKILRPKISQDRKSVV